MRRWPATLVLVMGALAIASPAGAQDCSRVVVYTLPAVTWHDVSEERTPELLALAESGAAGSISVRTISTRTSYASGFATIGAGSRVDAGRFSASVDLETVSELPVSGARKDVVVGTTDARLLSIADLREAAEEDGYNARPGALGQALVDADIPVAAVGNSDLGMSPPAPFGQGRWAALAAMDDSGTVAQATLGSDLLAEDPSAPFGVRTDLDAMGRATGERLRERCGFVVIDPGDLARADEYAMATARPADPAFDVALEKADELLGSVAADLDFSKDLLLVVSPTSPWPDEEVHLGIAVARGPGFEDGDSLESASTRRGGVVTLPDVAPTVLKHLGLERPDDMTGRPWFSVPGDGDVVSEAIQFDDEAVFVENLKTPVTAGFVIVQVLVYVLSYLLITRPRAAKGFPAGRWVQVAALCVGAFPISTFIAGLANQNNLGTLGAMGLFVTIDIVLVGLVCIAIRDPLDRLLAVAGVTLVAIFVDLATGATLQLNTVFGYSPVVAGRFAGLGNIGFALLGIAGLMTGALIAHRYRGSGRGLAAAAIVFVLTVVFDGAPQLGSDVGGVIALVPSLGLTYLLLSGRALNVKVFALAVLGGIVAVGLFLALDLTRPADEQTHLARLYEDVRDRGAGVFWSTIERKAAANFRLFKTTLWTYFVPPAIVMIALLVRRPRGRWPRLASDYPRVRDGLVGGLLLGAIGFAVNDSGIVIPAVVLTLLVPMAVVVHLCLDAEMETSESRP